jgi:RNA polymerase sigma-70 factor (ECF subfamily)
MLNTRTFLPGVYANATYNGQHKRHTTSAAANFNTVGVMSETKTSEFEFGNDWNPSNFEAIVQQYQPRIFRFIHAIVADTEIANDLTQDTFLSAYRNLLRRQEASAASGEPLQRISDNMSAWLYTIARNTAFSEMRRRKVVRFFSFWQRPNDTNQENEFDTMVDMAEPEPGGSLESRLALHDELQRAIDTIGRPRLVALLLHIDGFSYKEICDITGDSLSSVKSQIFRAKDSLRKALSAQGSFGLTESESGGPL